MSFLIKNDELLERYNEIFENVSNSIKKKFHGEPVYNKKHLKTKIKSCRGKSTQTFTIIKYQKKALNVLFS